MLHLFDLIEANTPKFVDELKEVVAIKSVSANVENREHVFEMAHWLERKMSSLGINVKLEKLGKQTLGGIEVDLPPCVLGRLGQDTSKKTLLVYGHYDVQPALKEDGWDSDPFVLVEKDEKLFGRGATDDKGPVLAWLHAIETFQTLSLPIPVNLVFCFEGMEESGSEGLEALILKEAAGYFKDVDCVCISDNYWLGKHKPCLTYGLRGLSYFLLTIHGPSRDLHSGVFGGAVYEPMTDLIFLLSRLVTNTGKILIPGIMDQVSGISAAENESFENLDFNLEDFKESFGGETIHETEKETLMARWRYPSLSIHGIEGAFYSPGGKTVIPAKVIGKFSIRTVPFQDPKKIGELVNSYLLAEFEKLKTKNKMELQWHGAESWLSDTNHYNYRAGSQAIKRIFNSSPDMIREGGSIPVTLIFEKALKKNVLLLPIGACDDGAHSVNEKINLCNFVNGIKVLAAYLEELAIVE